MQGGDIIANKKTFLWIRAHELAGPTELQELNRWTSDPTANPSEKVAAVTAIYNRLGIRELAESEMMRYFNRAMHHLEQVKVPDERKSVLREFAEQLMVREK